MGSGPNDLVFIPDAFSNVDLQWDEPRYAHFLNRLASFSRLIVFDKRGIGLSDAIAMDELPLELWMEDLRAVMDEVGSARPVLLGAGSGAAVAMFFAATFPERVSGLILVHGFARTLTGDDYLAGGEDAYGALPASGLADAWTSEDGVARLIHLLAPALADDAGAHSWMGRFLRSAAPPATAAAWARVASQLDLRHVLPAITAPTLVIHRSGNRFRNIEHGRYLADHIRGARFVELPGDSHIVALGANEDIGDEIEEFVTGARHSAEIDRVLATVMFTDIVGSTERLAELGDSRWRQVLDAHDGVVRAQIARFRGREVKTTGDGFLATFDGPARAIRCAEAITDAVASLGLQIRTGLHTGECDARGGDIGGIAVHIAARVGALAGPSEVLVSSTVKDLVVGSGIRFADRGSQELKGVTDAWHIFSVERK